MEKKKFMNEVARFIDRNLYFDEHCREDFRTSFSTRECGDVGSETPGRADFHAALKMKRKLEEKYGKKLDVEVFTVDEWTTIEVMISGEKKDASKSYS